jgi:hypothetical protein
LMQDRRDLLPDFSANHTSDRGRSLVSIDSDAASSIPADIPVEAPSSASA